MKIHEYQAKALLREFGVPAPKGDRIIRDREELKMQFAGPRVFIKIAGLETHPLDTRDRTEFVQENVGIGLCNIPSVAPRSAPSTSASPTTASSP